MNAFDTQIGGRQDIEKAIHYLEMLLAEEYSDADGG